MKEDIRNRDDIERLVNQFYDKVKADPVIGPIFNEQVRVNWEQHLPRMYDFWEHVLFQADTYAGNPMRVHEVLHGKVNLKPVHFDQWKQTFLNTVDELFAGEIAELAKQRALSIATIMQIKIHQTGSSGRANG